MTPEDETTPDGLLPDPDQPQDGVRALADTEAEAGDEAGLDDSYVIDRVAAREAGVDLDRVEDEPRLA